MFMSNSVVYPKFSPDVLRDPSPPLIDKRNLSFRQFWTQYQRFGNWFWTPPPLPTPSAHREIWFLADLDSRSTVEGWSQTCPPSPPPRPDIGRFVFLADLDSETGVCNCAETYLAVKVNFLVLLGAMQPAVRAYSKTNNEIAIKLSKNIYDLFRHEFM